MVLHQFIESFEECSEDELVSWANCLADIHPDQRPIINQLLLNNNQRRIDYLRDYIKKLLLIYARYEEHAFKKPDTDTRKPDTLEEREDKALRLVSRVVNKEVGGNVWVQLETRYGPQLFEFKREMYARFFRQLKEKGTL